MSTYFLGQRLPPFTVGGGGGIEFDSGSLGGIVGSCRQFGRFGHVSKIIRTHRQAGTDYRPINPSNSVALTSATAQIPAVSAKPFTKDSA